MQSANRSAGIRRGLTLVELMVVIGIIAILAGIIIPVVSRARASGRLVQCISNLRQFDVAFKGQDPNKPDTRLPPAETWVGVVAGSAPGAHKILQCPDGESSGGTSADGSAALFYAWRGNGTGNANGSRLNGDTAWRETRSNVGTDGSYLASYEMKPGGPSLVISYKPLGGDKWRATVTTHPGAPYRIDAQILSDGRRFIRVAQGFIVDYEAGVGGADYAFNALGSGLADFRSGKVVAMDFNKSVFDFDGWQTAGQPDDYLPAKVLTRRHLKKINALLSDGSVQSFGADEMLPKNEIYSIAKRGPNPGTNEPTTDASGGNGGGNGGNGGGNGGNGGGNGGNGGGNGGKK
jgi:prepilin-type N-terminal cleavage/methylation domain-containing protein